MQDYLMTLANAQEYGRRGNLLAQGLAEPFLSHLARHSFNERYPCDLYSRILERKGSHTPCHPGLLKELVMLQSSISSYRREQFSLACLYHLELSGAKWNKIFKVRTVASDAYEKAIRYKVVQRLIVRQSTLFILSVHSFTS